MITLETSVNGVVNLYCLTAKGIGYNSSCQTKIEKHNDFLLNEIDNYSEALIIAHGKIEKIRFVVDNWMGCDHLIFTLKGVLGDSSHTTITEEEK